MLLGGGADVVAGIAGLAEQRLATVLRGATSIVLGLLALAWPDVTLLVVAVVFGVRTVLVGLSHLWVAWRGDRVEARPARSVHLLGTSVALVAALALGSASLAIHRSVAVVDAFYTPPADVPAEPGQLLRAEPFTRRIPDGATAWRILYTTTRSEGVPAVASALVVAPTATLDEPVPVVSWTHGTTGIARPCAPSLVAEPFESGAFFALDRVLDNGWALVATDYIGLGTPGPHTYLVGEGEGRAALDAVRAARQLDDVTLGEQTVAWGHSQGGHAALWSGQLAPAYAPDVPLAGVAALAPAADALGLVDALYEVEGGSLFASYVVAAYAATYDDVRLGDLVPTGARVTVEELAGRCIADGEALVAALTSVAFDMSLFVGSLGEGPLATRLAENEPRGPFAMPVLLAQGGSDSLVRPDVQDAYVDRLCTTGQPVDHRTFEGRDHVGLVMADSPLLDQLVAWTGERLAGVPAAGNCPG